MSYYRLSCKVYPDAPADNCVPTGLFCFYIANNGRRADDWLILTWLFYFASLATIIPGIYFFWEYQDYFFNGLGNIKKNGLCYAEKGTDVNQIHAEEYTNQTITYCGYTAQCTYKGMKAGCDCTEPVIFDEAAWRICLQDKLQEGKLLFGIGVAFYLISIFLPSALNIIRYLSNKIHTYLDKRAWQSFQRDIRPHYDTLKLTYEQLQKDGKNVSDVEPFFTQGYSQLFRRPKTDARNQNSEMAAALLANCAQVEVQ